MKVLLINGSPRQEGNTDVALGELIQTLEANGIETEMVRIGHLNITGCKACGFCLRGGKCAIDDIINQELAAKFEECDGLVVASPVYFASPNGTLISLLDRLFYSTPFDKTMKVGASVVVARRGGCSAAFDQLNKYFTYAGMPLASSQYWNSVHGRKVGEAVADEEGLQTMRTLGNNMAFLLKSIALGKEQFGIPQKEKWKMTNFIG